MRIKIYQLILLINCSGAWEFCVSQPSASQNYVITNTVKLSGITNESMVPSIPIGTQGKAQTISYVDGLGRPVQSVVTQGSATQKDIVMGTEYDAYGREVKKYLPYADINNTAAPGSYKTGWQTTQAGFYNGPLQGVDADAAPYSVSVLEASPLNRLLAQGAPGTVWQPNPANPYDATKKTTQQYYEVNTAADNIRIFNVDMTTGAVSSPGFYAASLLTLKRSLDEHQVVTKEFTDKSGHLILKQVYIEADVLQTYYIYDDLDLLRDVIQPEGVALIPTTGSWSPDAVFTGRWMFQYNYDQRNRMISKQVPGAKPVLMMYDQWDRLVLTQDANMKLSNTWLFTKYDALNRPVVTGTIMDTRTQALIQTDINAAGRYETVNTAATEGYTLNASFPSSASYTLTVYTTTHYDSYANLPSWSSGYAFVPENGVLYKNTFLQGQVVGSQTRILNTSNWLRTVTYYDDKYRAIQSTGDNSAGGKDRITKLLSFDGKPTAEYQAHTSNVYTTAIVTTKAYTYDHADRVLKITHQIGAGETVTLAENAYNELGQLLNKKLHQSPSHPAYLQKLDYAYNIRGWLNNINKPFSNATGYEETDLFNLELHYNTTSLPGGTAQYNGNIAEQVWKGGYDEYLRGYKYVYDMANRLRTSSYVFSYFNGYQTVWDQTMRYDENMNDYVENSVTYKGYDRNGNMYHTERFHGPWNRVDDLRHPVYDGNKLIQVTDNIPGNLPVGFKDVNTGSYDYIYDNNGNLTFDLNKGINTISYNYLNLPILVDFGGAKGKIEYLYDAAGNKLQKTVTDQSVSPNKITITKYAGAFVYTNSYLSGQSVPAETLEFIGHEEGRIRPVKIDAAQPLTAANTKYIYDYFMKDHLGNTRMVLTTEQQTDVYAATQEPANATKENLLFSNLSSTIITKPGGFDTDNTNTKVSHLNGTANSRVGPSIILKVMAGDVISASTRAWYNGATQGTISNLSPIKDQLLTLLTNGIVANNGTQHGAIPVTDISTGSGTVLDYFLSTTQPPNYSSVRPKAFLNWIIVDEEFKKVSSSFHMGAVQVPSINTGDIAKTIIGPSNLTVRRNGWLYVYVSNESNQEVYFDDLIINHQRGPEVEMNNYYGFGLEIPGLASKAIGFGTSPQNRKKFNAGSELQSKEFNDGSGLELYTTNYRLYDPQIGRFMQIDPLAEISEDISVYQFGHDNPILNNDPFGLKDTTVNGQVAHRDKDLQNITITAHKQTHKQNSAIPVWGVSRTSVDNTRVAPNFPNSNANMRFVPANIANQGFSEPPYMKGSTITEYRTTSNQRFVRVYNPRNGASSAGRWMMKESDIRGLSPEQIQSRFALPGEALPSEMVEVDVPAGTLMRVGFAGTNSFGTGGGVQFQLMGQIPNSSFGPPSLLPTPATVTELPTFEGPIGDPIIPEGEFPIEIP